MDLTSHSTATAMNFTENQHSNIILERLYEQLADSKFCDVVLHVQNKKYHGHRCVLASCSPFLENTFREKALGKEHVTVNCQHLSVFENVFTYMYTGKITIDLGTIEEILRLANYFGMDQLKCYCGEYLERNLHVNNVYLIKEVADKWGLNTISKTAHGFVLANLLEVIEQDEILHFDEYKIDAMISNKSFPLTEELKVHIICRWVEKDIVKRHKMFQQLMAYIQWPRLNVQTLYTMVQSEKLFSESEWCMWHVLKLLEERGLLLHVYTESLRYLERKVEQGLNIEQQLLDRQIVQEKAKEAIEATLTTKKAVTDQSNTEDKTNFSVNAEENDVPVDTGFSSDSELIDNTHPKNEKTSDIILCDLPDLSHPDTLDSISNVKSDDDMADSAMDTSTDLNESLMGVSYIKKERGKHKRKGMPVKLRIPKSRLKLPVVLSRKGRRTQSMSSNTAIKEENGAVKREKNKRGKPTKKTTNKQTKRSVVKETVQSETEDEAPADLLMDFDFEEDEDDEDNKGDGDDDPEESDIEENFLPLKTELTELKPLIKIEKIKERKCRKKRESNMFILTCEHCQFKTEDEDVLLKHINKSHQDGINYSCSFCDFESKWNRQYYKHMKTHIPGPPFKCDFDGCDHVAERIQPLMYHRMRHTDERPHACAVCNMKFRTKNNLATHTRSHTGEKPWECNICNRSFATKGTLEQHSVTHSAVRPYLCDTCGFSTKYQSHLIAHKRIHTGDVFRCQYPNCKYYTPKRSQLACHMRSHMSIRQHICSVCSRAFVEKSHLVRHERIHLEDRPFKCTECDYNSTRRDKLKEHFQKYHSENSSPKNQYKPRKSRRPTFEPAAFPDYSSTTTSIQHDFDGQMDKAVQQRNEIRAKIVKAKKQNKPWPDPIPPAASDPAVIATTSELTQLKPIVYDSNSSNNATITTPATTTNNQILATATLNYQDTTTNNAIPIGVIDANNSNNILMGNLAFAIDSRSLGFIQPQGMQTMLNAIQPVTESSSNNQEQQQPTGANMTYNTTSQPGQVSADLSQLHSLMGGLFSGITNM